MDTTHDSTNRGSAQSPVTSAGQWRQASDSGAPLVVPSGNTCLVRPTSMKVLVAKNKIPNSLMSIIQEAMKDPNKVPTPEDLLESGDMDTEKIADIMDFIDAMVVEYVVQPEVRADPVTNAERDMSPDRTFLYVDEVDLDDKIFIWQYVVGGTRDLEAFRRRQDSYMELVPKIQAMGDSPQ